MLAGVGSQSAPVPAPVLKQAPAPSGNHGEMPAPILTPAQASTSRYFKIPCRYAFMIRVAARSREVLSEGANVKVPSWLS